MFKNILIAIIFFTGVMVSQQSYCQEMIKGHEVSVVSGKVVSIDVEGSVIKVKVEDALIDFYIPDMADLHMGHHNMSIIEITPGDSVKIKFYSSSGKNVVVKLVDVAQ